MWSSPPPWKFSSARVLYQPCFVPLAAARAATPSSSSGLRILSLFGWTLGGAFVVEWTDSPIGPYREVAVLSALVYNGGRLGAWASHIVVTTPDAVQAGRELFGLPAQLGSVTLDDRGGTDVELESADAVRLGCWDGWEESPPSADASGLQWPSLNLPSFSGCLPTTEQGGTSPLVYYPLTLGPARRVRLRPALRVRGAPSLPKELGDLFTSANPASPCLQVDGVDIVAGQPTEVQSDASALLGPDLPLRLWRAAKASAPTWCTGARGDDGDDDPLAALFNLMLIRLPFVAGCAVLLINTLLGGGVAMGDLGWPPAPSSDLRVP